MSETTTWELTAPAAFDWSTDSTPIAEWKVTSTDNSPGTPGHLDQDGGFMTPPQAGVDTPPTWTSVQDGLVALSSLVSLMPVIGTVKDIVEGATGWDMISGEKLSTRKRVFNFLAAFADIVSFGEAGAALKVGEAAVELPLAVRIVAKVGEGCSKVNDFEDLNTLSPTF